MDLPVAHGKFLGLLEDWEISDVPCAPKELQDEKTYYRELFKIMQ